MTQTKWRKIELIPGQHPILKKKCKEILTVDVNLIDGMKSILLEKKALGLAANQVGVSDQLFLMVGNKKNILAVMNPKIIGRSSSGTAMLEGCLSFPNQKVVITRPDVIDVTFINHIGERVEETFIGHEAMVFQHEYDHLQGLTMFDRAKRQRKKKKKKK